ncbi:MAG: SxtJ family membrane protein, partial [Actinomycetota bacterium]
RGHSTELQISGAILSAISFFVAFLKPDLLTKPNLYWMKFSLLLAKIVSPIVLGVLFFVLISPLAVALRIFVRDELSLKLSQKNSRWKMREVVGYPLESFKNQY